MTLGKECLRTPTQACGNLDLVPMRTSILDGGVIAAAQIGVDPNGRYRALVQRPDFGGGLELA